MTEPSPSCFLLAIFSPLMTTTLFDSKSPLFLAIFRMEPSSTLTSPSPYCNGSEYNLFNYLLSSPGFSLTVLKPLSVYADSKRLIIVPTNEIVGILLDDQDRTQGRLCVCVLKVTGTKGMNNWGGNLTRKIKTNNLLWNLAYNEDWISDSALS